MAILFHKMVNQMHDADAHDFYTSCAGLFGQERGRLYLADALDFAVQIGLISAGQRDEWLARRRYAGVTGIDGMKASLE
jgi:hypothetical protein